MRCILLLAFTVGHILHHEEENSIANLFHDVRQRRSAEMTTAGSLKCGRWPSVVKTSVVVHPPKCCCIYCATSRGTAMSFRV